MMKNLMDRIFKKVEGVVYDMSTNSIGVKQNGSIFSVTKNEDGKWDLIENPIESFAAGIPAFAKAIPLDQVQPGNLILSQSGEPYGWVTNVNPNTLRVLKPNGSCTNISPAKVNLLGQGKTVMVVNSMMSGGSIDPMMLLALKDDGMDMSELMMFMAMSNNNTAQTAQPGATPAVNPMANMLPFMLLGNKDKGSGSSDDMLKMLAMQGFMGQNNAQNPMGMDPMMLALLLGKK